MSGVVFGLFGFVWIRGRLDVTVPFMLHRQTVVLMLVWLVFCYALDRIANVVHTVGLLVGAFAGLVTARRPWRR
jgi:GlpG protein